VESAFRESRAILHGAYGGGEGDCLVAASPWTAGQRRRNGGSVHSILEHADGPAHAVRGHGLAGVQSGLVQALLGAGLHTRLFAEPDSGLEVSVPDAGGQADWSLVSGALLGPESRWRGHCHGRRRRDAAILERVQQGTQPKGEQIRAESVCQHQIGTIIQGPKTERGAKGNKHKTKVKQQMKTKTNQSANQAETN